MGYRAVLAGACGAVSLLTGEAPAQELRQLTPANVLVMPFDVTTNKASFQIVSRIGPASGTDAAVQTHWIFYAADCRHLVNVTVWLTQDDTVVMDPRAVQGQTQSLNPPVNHPAGAVTDLSGERGVVTVTAMVPNGSAPQLVGGWNIADTATNAAFGADAIGFIDPRVLPDASILDAGLYLPSLDPSALDDSQVIAIGLEAEGDGVVPIPRPSDDLDGAHVCCDVGFIDTLETGFSLPTFCFDCVGFAAIAGAVADPDEVPLIPPSSVVTSAGVIQLRNCRSGNVDGSTDLIGQGDFQQFLFAFHGQAVGPFGAAISGKYSRASLTQ